jgi:two-component system sensor histidine kinase KdpD
MMIKRLKKTRFAVLPYLKSLAVVALVTLLGWFARSVFGPMNLDMFYLLAIIMVALRWGRGPAVAASMASVLTFNYFFVPPYLSLVGFDLQSAFLLVGFLVVGLLISTQTSTIRQQAIETGKREKQTSVLYRLSKDLIASDSLDAVLSVIRMNIAQIFNCHVGIFLLSNDRIELSSLDPGFPTSEHIYEKGWILENHDADERGLESFKEARAHYAPLSTSQGVFGVLGISFKQEKAKYDAEDSQLLMALANQAAVAIQRTKLAEVSRQIELLRETEKLQTALLNSISHDLRTPLVSIMGVLDSLLHDFSSLDQQTREELLATAYGDSDHLNRLVGNLLDMTRLEAKALKTHIEPCELRDVIGASLQPLKEEIEKRNILIRIPEDLAEVPMDFVLMMRVFINLVDNAVKYSQPDTTIEITAECLGDKIKIDVKDEGIGIPKEDLVRIFDKFYRAVKPHQITGTGLGLSICKGIVEVHGGRIVAKNNPDRGVTVSVILPLVRGKSGEILYD